MNKDQFVRYKTLDECFRNINGTYTIEDLIEECNKSLKAFHPGEEQVHVSRRTIEKDLMDLQGRYPLKFEENLRLGKKRIYRYVDTSYSLMKDLLSDGKIEQEMLQGVLDTLSLYQNVPQYQWLYVFIQERLHGKGADGTKLISFDNNDELVGMEYFGQILNAILRQQPLSIEYKPFELDSLTFKAHPYLLKQFNRRWYLIARTEQYPLANIALDRIREVKSLDIEFMPSETDLNEYFNNIIGVTRHEEEPIAEVLLKINKSRYNYVRTKKIHHTQEVVHHLSDKDHVVIKLRVQKNNELTARILSFGCDMEVLEPQDLRDEIKTKVQQLYNMYL